MPELLFLLTILVVLFGTINLIRMTVFLVGSDIYCLKKNRLHLKKFYPLQPLISIIIPAHNEAGSISRCLKSIFDNNYPKKHIQAIVIDDGSVDDTLYASEEFAFKNKSNNITVVHQSNLGKAHALNNGMKNYVKGELAMCLDADSYLDKHALSRIARYFEDDKVMAVASNVKIAPAKGLLNLIQQVEYIVCYQMKKAQTTFNIEYIIGGIGSTFRKSFLDSINYYDANTVTEDIDITMKILRHGNKNVKVIYADDVISFTQSAQTIGDLIKQRYRWKWGRAQTFLKNKKMFFSRKKKFTKSLSWLYLPFAIFSDFAFFFEPILMGFILYVSLILKDYFTLASAFFIITFYLEMSIIGEESIAWKSKLKYILIAPSMYFLFYILSFVEYVALIKSFINIHNLNKSLMISRNVWKPVKRFSI